MTFRVLGIRAMGLPVVLAAFLSTGAVAQGVVDHATEVYRTTLEFLFFTRSPLSIGGHGYHRPELVVAEDSTAFAHGTDLSPDTLRLVLSFQFPAANPSVIDSLLSANSKAEQVGLPKLPVRGVVIRASELDAMFLSESRPNKQSLSCEEGWRRFGARFPGSQGLLQLSRVGFDEEGTQAMVYVGNRRGCLDGFGMIFLLERRGGGWRILAHQPVWVS